MRIYHELIYPWLVNARGDLNPIRLREQIVPLAEGTVLEIGVGPGVNFTHYIRRKWAGSMLAQSRNDSAGGTKSSANRIKYRVP
jgi:hypothetical protein